MPKTLKHRFSYSYCKIWGWNNLPNFANSCSFLFTVSCISYSHSNRDTRWHCRADIHFRTLSKWTNWKKVGGPIVTIKTWVVIWPSLRHTNINSSQRRSKSFCNSWIPHHACIEENIFSDGFCKMSCVCSQIRSNACSAALLIESWKWAVYHGQGHGHGPPLHLVAIEEEWNHSNHTVLHSVKSSFFIQPSIGNHVILSEKWQLLVYCIHWIIN